MAEGADKRAKGSVNTVGASNHSDKDREELDFYQTPSFATQSLLDLGIIEAHNIWEPMAGNGAIADILKQNKYLNVTTSDIVQRDYPLDFTHDFFSLKAFPESMPDKGGKGIITNPPYKVADDFILHALGTLKADYLAVFLPVRYLEGSKRYLEIYQHYKPRDVVVFARRLGCYKDSDVKNGVKITDHGIASAVAYMWLCFYGPTMRDRNSDTKLHWVY